MNIPKHRELPKRQTQSRAIRWQTNRADFTPQSNIHSVNMVKASTVEGLEKRKFRRLGYVYFRTQESNLLGHARRELDRLAHQMRALLDIWGIEKREQLAQRGLMARWFQFDVKIVGGHDRRRSRRPTNRILAESRAKEAAEYLAKRFTSNQLNEQYNDDRVKSFVVKAKAYEKPEQRPNIDAILTVTYEGRSVPDPAEPAVDWDPYNRDAAIDGGSILHTSPVPTPHPLSEAERSKIWAGIGAGVSGDLFVIGRHSTTAAVYHLVKEDEGPVRWATINIDGYKFGPGLGASGGGVFVFAYGYDHPSQFQNVSGGWDFDVAIGPKLSAVLKSVSGVNKVIRTMEEYKKLTYAAENIIKNTGITKPGIYTLPIPVGGGGLHLWGGYKFGDVTLIHFGKTVL